MRLFSLGVVVALSLCGCGSNQGTAPPPDMARPAPNPSDQTLAHCRAWPRPVSATGIALAPAFTAPPPLASPVGIAQAPGDRAHFYIWQQGGTLVRTDRSGASSTVLTLSIPNGGEHGLLGVTFSPSWATNHTAYLYHSVTDANAPAGFSNILSRITSPDGGATFDPASEKELLRFQKPYENHNGGNLLFGLDGYLYLGIGDGGSGGDPGNRAEDTTVLFGKMLRIDVENQATYAIPPTNPFASDTTGKRKEIYAYGMRNPWRWSFDRATGELWVGDVGQNLWEEVDLIKSGGNYGWHVYEGTHCYTPATGCSLPGAIMPIVEYGHSATGDPDPGIAVTGGYVYRGAAIPSLVGSYLFGDYGGGQIWRIVYDSNGKGQRDRLLVSGKTISSFGEDLDGELYVVGYGDGKIYKIVPGPTQSGGGPPDLLSATGCFDVQHPDTGTISNIAYDLNVALWSDGAGKRRWMALPPGAQIHVASDGHFDFPIGTVLVKEFSLGGKRVETRLLIHHDDGDWGGYSYAWRDDGSDADLLPSSATKDVGGQTWYFPSRTDCLRCHTQAAGRSLGPSLAQLNRDGPDGRNQLAALDAAGRFDLPLAMAPSALPAYPRLDDASAPIATRARAYLDTNCGFCHRMGGTGRVPPDWRFALSLLQTGACNAAPQDGDLGVSGAKIIAPASPATSVASLRMHALDAQRMPPLASRVVDANGTQVVDAWIASLTSCN